MPIGYVVMAVPKTGAFISGSHLVCGKGKKIPVKTMPIHVSRTEAVRHKKEMAKTQKSTNFLIISVSYRTIP